MLNEAKKMMRVTTNQYDTEIASLLAAGEKDLRMSGVLVPGKVAYSIDGTTGAVTDLSKLSDDYVKRAIITFAASRFDRNPATAAMYKEAYLDMKKQLMGTTGYTDFGGGDK